MMPLILWLVVAFLQACISFDHETVKVFQFTINYWREGVEGPQSCGPQLKCEWTHSDNLKILRQKFLNATASRASRSAVPGAVDHMGKKKGRPITLSVYNIHSWWERMKEHGPALCDLPTTLNLVESEESRVRYHKLFDPTFKHFDGISTTHPTSNVQRVYDGAFINESHFVPMHDFSSLIKAGAYVAGDCHKRDNANAKRDHIVYLIRNAGFRVEGLGRCMHTVNPEGVTLPTNPEARYDMDVKRRAISRFMFSMAFENSIEDGYVTEKPFDALLSGTVPVYLGDAAGLRKLLPHPKAAIFVADYGDNIPALVSYLNYLVSNETAYEEHRAWRRTFSYSENIKDKPILQKSWECRVCEWAVSNTHLRHQRPPSKRHCPGAAGSANSSSTTATSSTASTIVSSIASSLASFTGAASASTGTTASAPPSGEGGAGRGLLNVHHPKHARGFGGRNHTGGVHGHGHGRNMNHTKLAKPAKPAQAQAQQWQAAGPDHTAFPLDPSVFYVVDGVDVDLLFPPYIKWILKVKENREMHLLLNHTVQLIPDVDTLQSLKIHPSSIRSISIRDMKKWFKVGPVVEKILKPDDSYAPMDAFKPWSS